MNKKYYEVVLKRIAVVRVAVSDDVSDDVESDPYELALQHAEWHRYPLESDYDVTLLLEQEWEDEADIRELSAAAFDEGIRAELARMYRKGTE